jgi:hypothetical protein
VRDRVSHQHKTIGKLIVGEVLITPHLKRLWCYETAYKASDLDRFFGTTPATERDVSFGTRNVRRRYT